MLPCAGGGVEVISVGGLTRALPRRRLEPACRTAARRV